MAQATPTRRALVDLPVNSSSKPSAARAMGKQSISHKRRIHEVEDAKYVQPTSRVRLSPACSVRTVADEKAGGEPRFSMPSTNIVISTSKSSNGTNPHTAVIAEDMGEGDSQHSYKDSMSSLIDFDPDEPTTSQQTAATELTQPSPLRVSRHAETLRLRLRLAHFKVQTNQTYIPLFQLQISRRRGKYTMLSPPSSTLGDQPSLPKLLPAPVLRPTACSARTITKMQIPSSPPSSIDNTYRKSNHDEVFRTPALPPHATRISLQHTSSPPDDQGRCGDYNNDDNLTSSAVRGKAAVGLLGLRQKC